MARFLAADAFHAPEKAITLLPFRFRRSDHGGYLASNMVGDFLRLTENELHRVLDLKVTPGDGLYEKAYAGHLISREGQSAQLQVLGLRLRSRMAFLRAPTALHIFVTLRCEHSCPYCQVSRQSTDRSRFDITDETAERALAIALQSPHLRSVLLSAAIVYLNRIAVQSRFIITQRSTTPSELNRFLNFVLGKSRSWNFF
jgi:uncharacterized protein